MNEQELIELARRLVELREEKRYLEDEIDRVAEALAAALGPGARRELGGVQVRVGDSKPGLRIVRADDVPTEFRASLPDRRRLLAHVAATGEVPPGVEVTQGRPAVYAKGPASEAGA